MRRIATDISVDAGLIMVGDLSYIDKQSKCQDADTELIRLGKLFTNIPNGKYQVKWSIKNTWNGPIEGSEEIEITSGRLFVCDPCYLIGGDHDKWIEWLDKSGLFDPSGNSVDSFKDDSAFIISSMGGDGCYIVDLELDEIA